MATTELPLDVKLMTVVTHVLLAVFAVLSLGLFTTWLVRHPVWTVQAITVHGDVAHQNGLGRQLPFH